MKIFVGNLAHEVDEQELIALFAEHGSVSNVRIVRDGANQMSRGFGFVEMPSNSEADQAIKALNHNQVDGAHIKVRPADSGGKKRRRRPSRRRGH